MRYPNRRYGNPLEFQYYSQGITLPELSKRLRRSERTIQNWLNGSSKMPWWVPEIMRLQDMERAEMLRQMRVTPVAKKFGLINQSAEVMEFKALNERPAEENKDAQVPGQTEEKTEFVPLRAVG